MARIPKVQTTDRNVNQLQLNIAQVLQPIADNALVNGVFITTPATAAAPSTTLLSLASGANIVSHGLGRVPQGWIVTRVQYPGASVHETEIVSQYSPPSSAPLGTPTAALTEAFLYLTSSAAVTVQIYVF